MLTAKEELKRSGFRQREEVWIRNGDGEEVGVGREERRADVDGRTHHNHHRKWHA